MFIGNINKLKSNADGRQMRKIMIQEIGSDVRFLIDTGADFVCIPKEIIPENVHNDLRITKEVVKGPDKNNSE